MGTNRDCLKIKYLGKLFQSLRNEITTDPSKQHNEEHHNNIVVVNKMKNGTETVERRNRYNILIGILQR
jgi:hypothetical protein